MYRKRSRLEKKFRQEVAKRLGYKKGNMTAALEEAINDWIAKGSKKNREA